MLFIDLPLTLDKRILKENWLVWVVKNESALITVASGKDITGKVIGKLS
jgi:hypothetical protein